MKTDYKIYHVLCATDNNFAQHCAVMVCSLLSNNKHYQWCIHVLENSLTTDNKNKLLSVTNEFKQSLVFHTIPSTIAAELRVGKDSAVSDAAYWRLYVASIINDMSIERLLYLDCDIVVNGDLSPLYNIDMAEYTIAAIRDINNPAKDSQRQSISFSYRDRYFNSGVLLINMNKWREEGIEKKLVDCAKKLNSKLFPDQDPLNKVFRGKWLELSPVWNRFSLVRYQDVYFQNKADELDYIYHPRIIHYASPVCRPWMRMRHVKFQKEYDIYLAKTPWKNAPRLQVDKLDRYKHIMQVDFANFLYRSPLLIKIVITFVPDIFLFMYYIFKYHSLQYYRPCRIK